MEPALKLVNSNCKNTYLEEKVRLEGYIEENDFSSITERYSIKHTKIPSIIAEKMQCSSKREYEEIIIDKAGEINESDQNEFAEALRKFIDGFDKL